MTDSAELKFISAPFSLKAVDEGARTFKGLSSTWDEDLGGDVIHEGAFARTIDHFKASGRVIPLMDGHPEGEGLAGQRVRRVMQHKRRRHSVGVHPQEALEIARRPHEVQ